MRVLVAALMVAFAAHVAASTAETCTPGATWQQECNTCRCSDTGFPMCTLKGCLSPVQLPTPKPPVPSPGGGDADQACTPGTTWKQECNTCRCSDTGFPMCTLKGCLSPAQLPTPEPLTGADQSCTPGATWQQECNTCRCGSTGIPQCTLKACIGVKQRRSVESHPPGGPRPLCTPGSFYRHGCQTCTCTSSGGELHCETTPPCVDEPSLVPERKITRCLKRCRPDRDDYVHCMGKCGIKAVAPTRSTARPAELTASNEMPATPSTPGACRPNTVWTEGCRMCICTSQGLPFCNRRGCPSRLNHSGPRPILGVQEGGRCRGGMWREGCNVCHCLGGRPACTKMWCPTPPSTSTTAPAVDPVVLL